MIVNTITANTVIQDDDNSLPVHLLNIQTQPLAL
jgi:hypothetical protein